jgi:hypothetical protein
MDGAETSCSRIARHSGLRAKDTQDPRPPVSWTPASSIAASSVLESPAALSPRPPLPTALRGPGVCRGPWVCHGSALE